MYSYTDKELYQELLNLELIPEKVLNNLLKNSKKNKDDLYSLILQEGLISDKNIGQIIANNVSPRQAAGYYFQITPSNNLSCVLCI